MVFTPPSLGAIFPAVIKQQKFDIANGVDITFVERPPDAYAAQFNSGEFQVGGSASVLILGLGTTRGVKASYLFNIFDFWGTVVTEQARHQDGRGPQGPTARRRPRHDEFHHVRMVRQAAGRRSGLAAGGQHGDARPRRLCARRPRRRGAGLGAGLYADQIEEARHQDDRSQHRQGVGAAGNGTAIPNLGVAAHEEWIEKNQATHSGLYRAYKQAAAWVTANPDAAAPLVAPVKDDADRKAIADMIRDGSRLAMKLAPAGKIRKEIQANYKAGLDVGLFKTMPGDNSIYGGEME